jgi:hypothetical protein
MNLLRPRASALALCIGIVFTLSLTSSAFGQTREEKVRADKQTFEKLDFWIYGDLEAGYEKARESGKPLLVVLRCIPCEECVKLDDELVHQNPTIRRLLDEFVCVRIVSTNGLDLSTFQFDYDQSFAAFFLNAEGAIYGRYGTRSHRTYWSDDVSVEGMAAAMEGALNLHRQWPKNKNALAGKRGPAPAFATPEQFPKFDGKYASRIDYQGDVVKSCIHCHQVGDAIKTLARDSSEPFPEKILFAYPHPKSVGLILDPKTRPLVKEVVPESPAAKAGFEEGDEVLTLAGQPLLSIADVQWVLHQTAPEGGDVPATVRRGGKLATVALPLEKGWRRAEDISWRASSWELRRIVLGGQLLESTEDAARAGQGTQPPTMALRVKHVGQYGDHALAKQAGVQVGDVLVSVDGRTDLLRETDVLAYGLENHRPGEKIEFVYRRGEQRVPVSIRQQE